MEKMPRPDATVHPMRKSIKSHLDRLQRSSLLRLARPVCHSFLHDHRCPRSPRTPATLYDTFTHLPRGILDVQRKGLITLYTRCVTWCLSLFLEHSQPIKQSVIMQPKSNNPLSRLPTWVSIAIGVFIGLIVANIFTSSDVSSGDTLCHITLTLSSPLHYGEVAIHHYRRAYTQAQSIQ